MKNKYSSKKVLWDKDSTTLSPVDERSLENSPVSTPTAGTGDQEIQSNTEPIFEKMLEISLSNENDDIQNQINNLTSRNIDLELENITFKEELLHKQRFITDLQEKYDDCIDTIVTLRDTIHRLESGQVDTNYLDEQKAERDMYERTIKELEKDWKVWRVKCNLLDLDNDALEQTIEELREDIHLMREDQNTKLSNMVDRITLDKPTINIANTKEVVHEGDPCSMADSAGGDSLTLKRDHAKMQDCNNIEDSPQRNVLIPKITLQLQQSDASKLPQLIKSRLISTSRPFKTTGNVLLPHPPNHSYCPKIMRPATPSIRKRYLPKVNFPLPCPFRLPSPPKTLKQNPANPKWKI